MQLSDWDTSHMHAEGIPRLRKDVCRTRIVDDERADFRGFASDCLDAMAVIGLFILTAIPRDTRVLDGEIRGVLTYVHQSPDPTATLDRRHTPP